MDSLIKEQKTIKEDSQINELKNTEDSKDNKVKSANKTNTGTNKACNKTKVYKESKESKEKNTKPITKVSKEKNTKNRTKAARVLDASENLTGFSKDVERDAEKITEKAVEASPNAEKTKSILLEKEQDGRKRLAYLEGNRKVEGLKDVTTSLDSKERMDWIEKIRNESNSLELEEEEEESKTEVCKTEVSENPFDKKDIEKITDKKDISLEEITDNSLDSCFEDSCLEYSDLEYSVDSNLETSLQESTEVIDSAAFFYRSLEFRKKSNEDNKKGPLIYMVEKISNFKDFKSFVVDVELFLKDMNFVKSRGFVNDEKIPLLDKFIEDLSLKDEGAEDLSIEKDLERDLVPFELTTYVWAYNFILLKFHYCLERNKEYIPTDIEDDYLYDIKSLTNEILSKLHPVIRNKLMRPGIGVILNTVVGYDSEYELKNTNKHLNELLSVQFALNTRAIIKLPIISNFEVGNIHALTSEFYKGGIVQSKEIIENIDFVLCEIRNLKHKKYLEYIEKLSVLLSTKGLQSFEVSEKGIRYYIFKTSEVLKDIKFIDEKGYSFKEDLIKDIEDLSRPLLSRIIKEVASLVLLNDELSTKQLDKILDKRQSRLTKLNDIITISFTKKIYLCCHLTNADLSVLKDFEELKKELDIVHKNFITLGKPLKYGTSLIYIRDTSLLAPMGKKSLAAVGSIYGDEYKKIDLLEYRGNMKRLLSENKDLFKEYALRDSEITLKHANEMEIFYNSVNKIGVPITLSSLGKQYVLKKWALEDYTYQQSPLYLLGDTQKIITPQGLDTLKDAGVFLAHFVGNYKGGRNESYMYGFDKDTVWYDYDLTSAYTTGMSFLGHPDLNHILPFTGGKNTTFGDKELLTNYIILKTDFEFPADTKYPSIPCYVDKSTTVYPLKGTGLLTGLEYLLAKKQGCIMKIKYGVIIPFKKVENPEVDKNSKGNDLISEVFKVDYKKPFYHIIKELQIERKKHKKGSLNELLIKELSNSLYGNVVRGISNKRLFDIKTGGMITLAANELSNPIIGSFITALIRTVIGETLHNIGLLGGRVVSVTTDGFITDIEDLENKMLALPLENRIFLDLYKRIRGELGFESLAYERKNKGKGIISWCTRGQYGIESEIKATTGFQAKGFARKHLINTFIEILESEDKHFEFIQQSLRGGNEIYKKGGHVTMLYKERQFNLLFDNRRRIIESEGETLLTSLPLKDISEGQKLRGIKSFLNVKNYNKNTTRSSNKTYKGSLDSAVRTFIKGLLAEKPMFGLEKYKVMFKTYNDIILFLKGFDKTLRVTKSSISHLKNRKLIMKSVELTPEVEKFVDYLKQNLENFRDDEFYKNNNNFSQ